MSSFAKGVFCCALLISLPLAVLAAEIANDSHTLLMARFDGSLVTEDSELPSASTGTTYVDGLVGMAVHTGDPGYVQYSASGNISPEQGTVEFWMKPDWNGNDDSTTHLFFQIGYNFNNGMLLSIDGASNLRYIQWGDDPDTPGVETNVERGIGTGGGSLVAGTWYHFAATWNGNTRTYAFYLNGQQIGEKTDGVYIGSWATSYMNLGASIFAGEPSLAAFDEFRVYDRARTSGEILSDYYRGMDIDALAEPWGLTVDSQDRIILAEAGAHMIRVYDSDGNEELYFGGYGTGDGKFNTPKDVAVDDNDNIYVADTLNHRIQVFDSGGTYVAQFGSQGTDPGQFNAPEGIFVEPGTGDIYVADTQNHRVQRFLSNLTLDTSFNGSGYIGTTGVLKYDHTGFNLPTDVMVSPQNNRLCIAEYGNHRIEVYNKTGQYGWSRLAVYRPNSLFIDSAGSMYIAGEDPNEGYTRYDGRLRYIEAGNLLATKHYPGGLDDIGRKEGGVALLSNGDVVFSDSMNGRLVRTDASFSEPITDLEIEARGTTVTFKYKTRESCVGSVRYGPTNSYGTEVSEASATTDHEIVVNGLTENTRLFYGVSFADSFNGNKRWTPQDVMNTGAAPGHTQFLRLKGAAMIYLDKDPGTAYDPCTTEELDQMRGFYEKVSRFYWINSGFKLWLDYTIIEIDKNLETSLWIWSVMESDLTAEGYSAADDFDVVHAACRCANGNYGGGGSLFGRGVGVCHWVSQSDFVPIHEINHTIDSIYAGNDLGKYEFNHGIWAVPGSLGADFVVNGRILKNMLPVNFTATKTPFTKIMTAVDDDNDGVPDYSPAGLTQPLCITEATLGSSTLSADSDGDGVSDLDEAVTLCYHGTDLNSSDSDGDGVLDANDINPLYNIRDHIAKGTPSIDGSIFIPEGWTQVTSNWGFSNEALAGDNDSYQGETSIFAAWDDDYFYLGLRGPSSTSTIRLDGSADNWFFGPDNYRIVVSNYTSSMSVSINVGVPDIFRQIDNDGQWSELFDTNAMFTNPWQGRTLYDHGTDGFGFSSRLVTESDITYAYGGTLPNHVWELRIPYSTKTGFKGYPGREMGIDIDVSGDRIFEADDGARLRLVEVGDPVITGIRYTGGETTLTFDTVPGMTYNIYYRDSLDAGWTLIESVTGQGVGTQYVDDGSLTSPSPSAATSRFYRVGM